MLSSSRKPVSAKQNLPPPLSRACTILLPLLGFFLLVVPLHVRAESLEDAARLLARKVSSSIRGTPVSCEFRNLSSLPTSQFASFSAAFEEELQRQGVKILSPAANTAATLSLVVNVSQNPTEYLGVVRIQRTENPETMIEAIAKINGPAAPEPAFSLTLRRQLLLSQDGPILDVALDNEAKHAQFLGVREISSYELQGEQWILTGSDHLPIHQPPDRSQRGLFFAGTDSQTVYLPGELCRLSLANAKGWSCEGTAGQLPPRGVSESVMAGKKVEPWISAAQFETGGKTKFVVTGQDGLARLYEDGPEPVAIFSNWGSEIASIYSGCGSGWQLLVTGKGDWTAADAVQAIDLRDRRALSVSAPMEFPGPIVALRTPAMRTAENAAANGRAVVIDRNLQTGRYEAYQLSITCSR